MRVVFLDDFDLDEDGNPLYSKGEIAYLLDDFAAVLISNDVVRPI